MAIRDGITTPGQTAAAQAAPEQLHLLTLNCWGLLHISALRSQRISHIGTSLATMSPAPDIVGLQELFTQEDYRTVRRRTRHVLPHGKFYHGGAFGAGLAILSRWPIEESDMHAYALNGRPTAFWRGDWYVGKGVARARVRFGPSPGDVVDVFNTHTHAPYERGPRDSYVCHRVAQAWDVSKLLRGAAERGHLVVALGDFNMLPLSLAHRVITSHAPVRDVWRVLHPDSSLGPHRHPDEASRAHPVPSVGLNLTRNGATSNNASNTWRWDRSRRAKLRAGDPCDVDPDLPDPEGQRLDYVFASTGRAPGSEASSAPGWVVESASVTMTHRHPDLLVSLSDHFAVFATLRRHVPDNHRAVASPAVALRSGAYLAAPATDTDTYLSNSDEDEGEVPARAPHSDYDAQLRHSPIGDASHTLLPLYDEIIALVERYTSRERHERRWRALHFYASLVIWVACLVAVWFSPHNGVAFAIVVVSSLVLAAGLVNGLLSLLFFTSELRRLKEFEWEIRNARAAASGDLTALDDDFAEPKIG